ncbi:MAG: helix-turn-helix domain-containing protein [Steroidobacteraceae bacterium]
MTEPIASVGPRLKAERERRALSAQKVADELRLDGSIIDALEAEDYERVGPSVFAKGHLKRYAAFLGLPADEIMAGYESRVHAPKPPVAPPANVRLRADAPAVSNLPWPQVVGSVAAILLVLGLIWWRPWHQRGAAPVQSRALAANPRATGTDGAANSTEGDSASAADSSSSTATASLSSTPPAVPTTVAPAAATANPPAPSGAAESNATAGMGRARLRLSFSADSWVDVHDAAGRRAYAGHGRANSVKTIAGMAPMRVYLGFASGVQLEINNRAVAIGPQFVSGDVARFEAGADGVLRRDSHRAAPGGAPPTAAPPAVRPIG